MNCEETMLDCNVMLMLALGRNNITAVKGWLLLSLTIFH